MKIAIIGGTGYVGNQLVQEALKRGHEVVSIAKKNKLKIKDNKLTEKTFSIFNEDELNKAIKGTELIISAYHPGYFHVDPFNRFQDAYKIITNVAKKNKLKLIAIGSSVSLYEKDSGMPVYDGFYNKAFLGMGMGMHKVLESFENDRELKWTMVLPSIEIAATSDTRKYKVGEKYLFVDEYGESRVSLVDLADAVLNEVENPKYENKSFTVGY